MLVSETTTEAVVSAAVGCIEPAQAPDISADPPGHQSTSLNTFGPGAGAEQQGHFRCAQRCSGADGKGGELKAVTQLTQFFELLTVSGFQPGQVDLPLFSKPLHQAETDHAESLVGSQINGFHGGLLRDSQGPRCNWSDGTGCLPSRKTADHT